MLDVVFSPSFQILKFKLFIDDWIISPIPIITNSCFLIDFSRKKDNLNVISSHYFRGSSRKICYLKYAKYFIFSLLQVICLRTCYQSLDRSTSVQILVCFQLFWGLGTLLYTHTVCDNSMYAEHILSSSYTVLSFNSFQIKGRQKNKVNQMLTVCMTSSLNIWLLRMSLHATYKPFLINSVSQPDASCKQR